MLFGWKRVSPGMHLFATAMVCFGTVLSAFWIMSANSWMQTPAGFLVDGTHLVPESFWTIVFNPSFLTRFTHMVFSALLTASFFIMGISCYYLITGNATEKARITLKFTLIAALILAPMQLVVGDLVGLKVYEHQPMKTAAMEGLWKTQKGAPLLLFAIPNQEEEKNDFELGIPKLASYINTHDWDGEMQGLDQVSPDQRPNVMTVFWTFRIMVGLGLLFVFVPMSLIIGYKRLERPHWFHYLGVIMTPMGLVATRVVGSQQKLVGSPGSFII